jgi:hypothetical protein
MSTVRLLIPMQLLVIVLLAAPVAAEPPGDPLQELKARREVEAQRLEREVKEGRDAAYRIGRVDAQAAIRRIQGLVELVEVDDALSPARKEQLLRTLKRDISTMKTMAGERRAAAIEAAERAEKAPPRRTEDPKRTADARSVFDTARGKIDSMKNVVADARSIRFQVADRYSGALRQVDLSSKLPADDIEFPADWVEKSKKRSPEQKLTAREKELLDALKKPVNLEYNGDTFGSVIEHLSKLTGQTILVDKNAMEEANVTNETPITLKLPRVSTRTALKKMLKDLGLTYVIREEAIHITTPARAKELMVTRAYYVGDLLGVTDITLGPAVSHLQMVQTVGSIINTIQNQIEPDLWQANNGPGTIVFDPISMSLLIKASAEVHYMLGGGR